MVKKRRNQNRFVTIRVTASLKSEFTRSFKQDSVSHFICILIISMMLTLCLNLLSQHACFLSSICDACVASEGKRCYERQESLIHTRPPKRFCIRKRPSFHSMHVNVHSRMNMEKERHASSSNSLLLENSSDCKKRVSISRPRRDTVSRRLSRKVSSVSSVYSKLSLNVHCSLKGSLGILTWTLASVSLVLWASSSLV